MRAAVLHAAGETPVVEDVQAPTPEAGAGVVVRVEAAGLNPSDRLWADAVLGDLPTPRVVGNEGVGRVGARRVYFERSIVPHGSFAQQAVTRHDRLIDLDDEVDAATAVALGISSLAGWVPLEYTAALQPGESVLVLGASGPVGLAAVQAARLLGASWIVAAARHRPTLDELSRRGLVDEVVELGRDDQRERLAAAARGGYDVVVDPLFGQPLVDALPAVGPTGRILQLGMSAGPVATIPWLDLLGRSLLGYKNTTAPFAWKQRTYGRMLRHAMAGDFVIPTRRTGLDQLGEVWSTFGTAVHEKLVIYP